MGRDWEGGGHLGKDAQQRPRRSGGRGTKTQLARRSQWCEDVTEALSEQRTQPRTSINLAECWREASWATPRGEAGGDGVRRQAMLGGQGKVFGVYLKYSIISSSAPRLVPCYLLSDNSA